MTRRERLLLTLAGLALFVSLNDGARAQVSSVFGFFDQTRVAGTAVSVNTGNADAGSQRVVLARDSEICNGKDTSQVAVSVSASGNTELVALTSSQTIYVCDAWLQSSGTTAFRFIYGTGTACATGETNMSGPVDWTAQAGFAHNFDGRLKTAASNALCIKLGSAVAVNGVVTYRKANTF
jgi:hypothetical protein